MTRRAPGRDSRRSGGGGRRLLIRRAGRRQNLGLGPKFWQLNASLSHLTHGRKIGGVPKQLFLPICPGCLPNPAARLVRRRWIDLGTGREKLPAAASDGSSAKKINAPSTPKDRHQGTKLAAQPSEGSPRSNASCSSKETGPSKPGRVGDSALRNQRVCGARSPDARRPRTLETSGRGAFSAVD